MPPQVGFYYQITGVACSVGVWVCERTCEFRRKTPLNVR